MPIFITKFLFYLNTNSNNIYKTHIKHTHTHEQYLVFICFARSFNKKEEEENNVKSIILDARLPMNKQCPKKIYKPQD